VCGAGLATSDRITFSITDAKLHGEVGSRVWSLVTLWRLDAGRGWSWSVERGIFNSRHKVSHVYVNEGRQGAATSVSIDGYDRTGCQLA
jgi:hypothetical protein